MDYYKNLDLNDIVYFCEFDNIIKTEQWKDIPDYEGIYQVSDLGRIKSLNYRRSLKNSILKSYINNTGYLRITLSINSTQSPKSVHEIVAISFLYYKKNDCNLVVNHKDFNRINNQKNNLEIITQRQNTNKNHIKSSSKYVGVYWNKNRQKWVARIRIKNIHKYLGSFLNEIDASIAYQNELKKNNYD